MITSDQVIAAARKYLGAPVVEGGRSYEGTDCVGVLLGIGHELGIACPQDVRGYGLNPWLHPGTNEVRAMINEYTSRVESPQAGDVVLFGLGRMALSVGIVTAAENGTIKTVISGLELGTHFTEHEFVPDPRVVPTFFRIR